MPGTAACRPNRAHNRCLSRRHHPTARYECTCSLEYRRAENLPPHLIGRLRDNCLYQVDPCELQGCMHGICVLVLFGNIEQCFIATVHDFPIVDVA